MRNVCMSKDVWPVWEIMVLKVFSVSASALPGLASSRSTIRFSASKFSGGKFLFLKLGFNRAWTVKLQMYKLPLEKAEKAEIKLPTSAGSQKKRGNSKKISTSASLTVLKPLTVWITTNCGKFLERWEYQTTLLVSWETCMQDKKHQNMEQWTGSKLEKEYVKAVTLLI